LAPNSEPACRSDRCPTRQDRSSAHLGRLFICRNQLAELTPPSASHPATDGLTVFAWSAFSCAGIGERPGPRYRCDGACRPKNAKQESLDHDEKQMAVDHSRGGRGRNGLGRVCALHAFSAPAKPPLVGLTPLVSGAPSSSQHEKTPGAEDARGRSDRLAGQEGGPTKFSLRFIRYNRAKPRCNRTPAALPEFCCCFFAAPDGRRVAPSAWPEAELRRLMRR